MSIAAWLQGLPEKRLYSLIEELLKAMNYKRVECTHGPGEVGKDIVFMEDTPIHRRLWRAVQVKVSLAGNIKDHNNALAAIMQCEAALRNQHQTSQGQVVIDQVWLVVARPLSDSSKRYIQATLNEKAARVLVIDGPELADLVAEYLPNVDQADYDTATSYIRELLAFSDSPDEFLATLFNAKFRLSTVFVRPNCAISLMDTSGIREGPTFAKAVDWDVLRDLPLNLEALNNGILSPAGFVGLRSALAKLDAIGQAMELSKWEPRSTRAFRESLEGINARLEAIGSKPLARREDLDGLYRGINKLGYSQLEKLKADYEREKESVLSRWPRQPTSTTTAADEYARLRRARTALVREFAVVHRRAKRIEVAPLDARELKVKGSSIGETPTEPIRPGKYPSEGSQTEKIGILGLSEESLVVARLLSPSRSALSLLEPLPDEVLNSYVIQLRQQCETFGEHICKLAAEYLVDLYALTGVLNSPLDLHSFSNAQLSQLSRCNQLTFLLAKIFDAQDHIQPYAIDAFSAMSALPCIAFYGDLGIGKTTLGKQLCLQVATERRDDRAKPMPVHVALGSVKLSVTSDQDLELDIEQAFLKSATKSVAGVADQSPEQRLFILDGLDELADSTDRRRVIEWCVSAASRNRPLLVSSRPHALPCYLPGISRVAILPFSREDVARFVVSLPWSSASEANELIDVISQDRSLTELSRTPLLLTLLVIVAQVDGARNIPRRKEKVYRRIVSLMLYEWDRKKRLKRKYSIPDEDVRLTVLRKVAFYFHERGQRTFRIEAVLEAIMEVMPTLTTDVANRYIDELLRDCLLCPISGELFAFFHLSIQEYLVGVELSEDCGLTRTYRALEDYFRVGSWWEEPLVFWGGIKRDVSALVTEMNDHVATSNRDDARMRVRRLIERWMQVADLTPWQRVNPRGIVAETLGDMRVGGEREIWMKLAAL